MICTGSIPDSYYSLTGKQGVYCERCRDEVLAQHGPEMRMARVTRASIAGFIAGVLGCLLYYAVARFTGREFGLVAIVVGFLVGSAVRWGSFARGGWSYQLLAIGITYVALVGTVIPFLIDEIQNNPEFQILEEEATEQTQPAEPIPLSEWLVAVATLSAFILSLPFWGALENPIGLLIIGVAVFEAWRVNRGLTFEFKGPIKVGAPPPRPDRAAGPHL